MIWLLRLSYFGLLLMVSPWLVAQAPAVERPLLVGYFPQWGLYADAPYLVRDLVRSGAAARLDQLNYAQAFVTHGECSVADPHADTDLAYTAAQSVDGVADRPEQVVRGGFNQLAKLKKMYPRLKLLISLEGRASDFAADAEPAAREHFVSSCVQRFLAGHLASGMEIGTLFDGVDVDWEYPAVDSARQFVALLAELRRQMNALRPGLVLSIAVGPSPQMAGGGDLTEMAALVDEVGVMTYDMAGPWSDHTGLLAPLVGRDGKWGAAGALSAYVTAGVPARKLLMGVPFYGYAWDRVEDETNGLYQEGQGRRGDHPYSEIAGLQTGSKLYRDPESQAPWLFDGDVFWTFDDPASVRFKAEYVREHGLGGVMAWDVGEDTADGALVNAAWKGLRAAEKRRPEQGVQGAAEGKRQAGR